MVAYSCDETVPACRRCVQRNETCSLAENTLPFVDPGVSFYESTTGLGSENKFGHLTHATIPPRATQQRQNSVSSFTAIGSYEDADTIATRDLEWIQQYLTETCQTLCFTPEALRTWREDVFQLAISVPFLLHGIIALAAMHKALNMPLPAAARQHCVLTAVRHRNKGLELFIPVLNNANSTNCVALCSFNILFSTLAFASQNLPEDLREATVSVAHGHERMPTVVKARSAIGSFVEVISFWRGTDAIISETYEWLQTSKIGNLFRLPDFDKLPDIPDGAAKTLDLLRQRAELPLELASYEVSGSSERAQKRMYMLEIQRLYKVCKCTQTHIWGAYILAWPTNVTTDFVELLRSRDNLSLAMVAFWASCFHTLNDRWWAKNWSSRLIEDVTSCLSTEWDELLQWPRTVLGA
ncbi:hypothetical protein MMC18_008308 [Xylographa bjoerkii]|nr:hypothetical protein [Xylographa bjoerkii]